MDVEPVFVESQVSLYTHYATLTLTNLVNMESSVSLYAFCNPDTSGPERHGISGDPSGIPHAILNADGIGR